MSRRMSAPWVGSMPAVRLVEQQGRRVADQRDRESHALPRATRQGADAAVGESLEPGELASAAETAARRASPAGTSRSAAT